MALLFRFSLRANLFLIFALAALVILGDRIGAILHDREAAIEQAMDRLEAEAVRAADRQNQLFSDLRIILSQVARSAEATGLATACGETFGSILSEFTWLSSMAVANASGDVGCSVPETTGSNVSDRDYFTAALSSGAFVVSDYLLGRRSGKSLLVAAMPIGTGSDVRGAIIAGIDLDLFAPVVAAREEFSSAEVLLLDRPGVVVSATPGAGDEPTWIGRDLSASGLIEQLAQDNGILQSTALDGRRRIIAYDRIPTTGTVLIVHQEFSDIVASVNREAITSLATLGGLGLVCILLFLIGGEILVLRPIAALTKRAERLGDAEPSGQIDTSLLPKELRPLGDTLNGAAERLERQDTEIRAANARLLALATRDGLTGLSNRRQFDEKIEIEADRSRRERTQLALIMVDIDHFKKFNDSYGHFAGDECLRKVAEILKTAARRAGDVAARTGGEEFAVVLPKCRLSDAIAQADEIRRGIEGLGIPHVQSEHGLVTASVGVAAISMAPGTPLQPLLDRADAALYRAKHEGRNRVAFGESLLSIAS